MSRLTEKPSPKIHKLSTLHHTAFYVTHDTFIGGTSSHETGRRNWTPRPKSLVEGDGERKMREFKDQLLKDQELLGGRGDTQEKTKPGMLRSKSNLTESTLKPQIIVRSPSEERSRKETQGRSSGEGIKRKPSKKMGKGRKTGREEERMTVEKQLGEEKAMVIDISGRVTRTGDTSTEEDVFTLDEDLAEELEKSRNEEELKYREEENRRRLQEEERARAEAQQRQFEEDEKNRIEAEKNRAAAQQRQFEEEEKNRIEAERNRAEAEQRQLEEEEKNRIEADKNRIEEQNMDKISLDLENQQVSAEEKRLEDDSTEERLSEELGQGTKNLETVTMELLDAGKENNETDYTNTEKDNQENIQEGQESDHIGEDNHIHQSKEDKHEDLNIVEDIQLTCEEKQEDNEIVNDLTKDQMGDINQDTVHHNQEHQDTVKDTQEQQESKTEKNKIENIENDPRDASAGREGDKDGHKCQDTEKFPEGTKLENESRTESEYGQEVILPDNEDGEGELNATPDSKRKTNKRKKDKKRNKKGNNAEKVENVEKDPITIDPAADKMIAKVEETYDEEARAVEEEERLKAETAATLEAERMIINVERAARAAAREKYNDIKKQQEDALERVGAESSSNLTKDASMNDSTKDEVESAGVEAAMSEFSRFTAKEAGDLLSDAENAKYKIKIEKEENLSEEIETVARQAAAEEYAKLKIAEVKLKDLIVKVEAAARNEANSTFHQLRQTDGSKDHISEDLEDINIRNEINERTKADVEKAGFKAAEAEYDRLKDAEEEVIANMRASAEDDAAWTSAEKEERHRVEQAGRIAVQEEYRRLLAEEVLTIRHAKERAMKENDLLSRVETAAKEAAKDLFNRLNTSSQEDAENMYEGDINPEEKVELEKSSVEVAAVEFDKHMADKKYSNELENENYRCDLKNKMENAGREAGKEEYYRLKADSEIRKTKKDILMKLKDSVEEAARKAARETYTLMKTQEEAITEVDNIEAERTEQLLLNEVLKAGITAAESEYDKQKESIDSVIEVDKDGRLRAAQKGRHAAEVEFKRLKEEGIDRIKTEKEHIKKEKVLITEVEGAAKDKARELFERIKDAEEFEKEEAMVENISLDAAAVVYDNYELEENKELKIKLEEAGTEAAKVEYAKLKEDTVDSTHDPDLNLTHEIEEAASKAAKAAFDLLSNEENVEKITRKEVEEENENIFKNAVESSGAKAAGNEYERLKTVEQTVDGLMDGEIEGIDIMEEAGRAAAHEEYVKMKSMEDAIIKASKLRTDDEITLLNEVRDVARKAAKEIFVSINMAEQDNVSEEEEQKLLEKAGQEAADSHYNNYIAEISRTMEGSKDNLKDKDVIEIYKSTAECEEFKLKIEETSRNAVIEEFNKLRNEAKIENIGKEELNVDLKIGKNKKDIVQKFKYRVEEAAINAARETYWLMKAQEEAVTELDDIEKERTEQLLLDEVLKAGITAAEFEYDKQKESHNDAVTEINEEGRHCAAQRGRHAAEMEYKRLKEGEIDRIKTEREHAKKGEDLVAEVETQAKEVAKELFKRIKDTEEFHKEKVVIENVSLDAVAVVYDKYEVNEMNELKHKLEAAGTEAAKVEYAKLKEEATDNNILDPDLNLTIKIEEAASKAAKAAFDLQRKEDDAEKVKKKELEDEKENLLENYVEISGAIAAGSEYEKLKSEDQSIHDSSEGDIEGIDIMEEAGRAAAEEEFIKMKSVDDALKKASKVRSDEEINLLNVVRDAARKAAKEIFVSVSMAEQDNVPEEEEQKLLERAGQETADSHYSNYIAEIARKMESSKDNLNDVNVMEIHKNKAESEELKNKVEETSRNAAIIEFARLKDEALRIKLKKIFVKEFIAKLEKAAILEAREILTNEDHKMNEEYDEISSDDEIIKNEIANIGAAAATEKYCTLNVTEKDFEDIINEYDAEHISNIGRQAALQEYDRFKQEKNRLMAEKEFAIRQAKEREMKENDLLSRVETAAKEAARDLFDRINKSCQDDIEKMYDGDVKHDEQLELEKSSVEVAAAEFIKHMAEKQHSDDLENENYRCDLKNKMENAGREAGKEEYYRLKADSEIRKSKQDILKILKDSVEEAARQAARETYTLMKIQEEAITEEDDTETEGTEQLILDEVLKAGITAAECEYDKQKTSLDDSVIDDEGRLRAAQRGRHAAEVEYKRLKAEEFDRKRTEKEHIKKEKVLITDVEGAAKARARELFERIKDTEEFDKEEDLVENVSLESAAVVCDNYEVEENKELKHKLEEAGTEAAKVEYAKLKEDTTNDTLDPDLNLTQEIDEAASKAAKAAFDLLRKEDDAEKVTRIEVEKENILKIAVENSGAKAAGNEYERLKTGEQTFDGSVEGEIEGIDIMEEAGRAAAHEEYVKMKSMEEAIKKASKLRTDDEITLLNEVRDAARKAAKEIFVSINMAEKDNVPEEEEEQKLLERAGQEAADSHYNIYIAEISRKMENSKDNLKDTDVMEIYKNTAECEEFKLRIEETSRNAVIEEFNKLKKEAKIEHVAQDDLKTSMNKKDLVQKFKYRVEEAARDAAREAYTLMKTQEEAATEEDDIEKERTEQLLLDEVLKAGITAAEFEYDKQKESGGDTAIEVDEEGRLRAAQRGKHAAEVEYKRLKEGEIDRIRTEREHAKKGEDLVAKVETQAKDVAKELFEKIKDTEELYKEEVSIENVNLDAVAVVYDKYEVDEKKVLKLKLETAGTEAAKDEYAKLKEGATDVTLDPNLNLTDEIEEAASKAAKAAFDLQRKEDDAEKVRRKEEEVEKDNLLKITVENSGAKAAGKEYEKLKTEEQNIDGSIEGDIEGIDIMEEAGRAAAHEEFIKMKSMEDAIKKASKERADEEITLLNKVRDAARKAAKEIFISVSMAEQNDVTEEEEQKLLERAGQEAADSHYNNYIAEITLKMESSRDNLIGTDIMEIYKNKAESEEFKNKIEETSRNAAIIEFARLKDEALRDRIKKRLVNELVNKLKEAAISEAREVLTNEDHQINEEYGETSTDDEIMKDEISNIGAAAATAKYCALEAIEEDFIDVLNEFDPERVSKIGRHAALQEYDRFKQEKNIAKLLKGAEEAAKEAAREMFTKVTGDLEGDDVIDITLNDQETAVTNAGIEAAGDHYSRYIAVITLHMEDVQNDTNSDSSAKIQIYKDLREKLESAGYEAAKLEYERMAAEAEDLKIKKDREANIRARVVEIARQAARSLYASMTAEELEASGGHAIEFFDEEREKIFKNEIANAGAETALEEFVEFIRRENIENPVHSDIDGSIDNQSEEVDEETKHKVKLLGWEAAASEYELLRNEEQARLLKLKEEEEARLRAEEEARIRAEEEARLRAEEEARLRAEEEARLRAEEEARIRAEEEARIRAEEEARLRAEEEARIKAEEEARIKAEEEARLKAEEEARIREEQERQAAIEAKLRAEEEERRRAEEELERIKQEERDRIEAEAVEEMKRILERQKAAAEARAKARDEGEEESPEHAAFRKAQEDMRRALELSASEGLKKEDQESNGVAWLTLILTSLALYWALRTLQDYVEEDHRDSLNMAEHIKPYIYFEIKKWP